MPPSLRRSLLLAAAGVVAGLSCGREITGPDGGTLRVARALAIEPVWPDAIRGSGASLRAAFDRIHIRFLRSSGAVALERAIEFPAGSDEITLSFDVPIAATAPASGEPMSLYMDYLDASGAPVFTGGPVAVLVVPSRVGEEPPAPLAVPLTYVGTGSQAASVVLSPAAVGVTEGDPAFQFTAVAYDGQGVPIPGTPVLFSSSDTSVLLIGDDGRATGRPKRGTVQVVAKLYTGPADTADVTVSLRANSIALVSGNGQTGIAGAALSQDVVVRVLAADALPVMGVAVQFAAGSGGAPGAATVLTDADGYAGTSWTLGAPFGAQSLTATVPGLSGSPVTFTATAIAGAPSELAFTAQPSAVTAGVAIAPAVTVTARTAGGQTSTGFTGPVTIALAANPGGAVLGGTLTVNAVAGVATFPDLTLDKAGAGYTLVATSGILTDATSSAFTVNPAAPTALVFIVPPVGGNPGTPLVPAPTVGGLDAFGNVAPLATPVTVALGANPGGATLSGTLTVAPTGGVAAFADLELDATGAGYTLVATATGLTAATSDPFAIGAFVISWTNASGGLWSVPSNWNLGRVPEPGDVVDITLGGTYTVTLDASPSVSTVVLGGSSGTQTLAMTSRTLTVGGAVSVGANGVFLASNSTIAGPGILSNEGEVTLVASTVSAPVSNVGTLRTSGASAISGALVTSAGSILRVGQVDGSTSQAALTVANGFVNLGTIELTVVIALPYNAQLTVTNGVLVNAGGGTIAALGGASPGGARTLTATLDNQGLVDVQVPLLLNGASAAHLNSGTIDLSAADLTVSQGGVTPSFTNTGTITLGSGRTLTVTGGSLTLQSGTLGGPGTLSLSSTTLGLGVGFDNAVTALLLTNSTVNGPGTLTNASGRTLTLVASTVNAPLANQGTLVASGSSVINGALTTNVGSILRVGQVDGSTSQAALTVANGFVNAGTIELTVVIALPYNAQLTVTSGVLENAAGGTIAALGGAAPGGARTLTAALDNQGLVDVQVPLLLNGASAAHLNSGTIDLSAADLTVSQGGVTPSFTNTGTITLGSGRTLTVTGGSLTLQSGTLGGPGTLSLSSTTLGLGVGFDNAVTALLLTNSTVNGPGTLTNASGRTLTLVASTVNAPLANQGTLVASGSSAITGALTTIVGSTLRVGQVDGSTSQAALTVANGFVNLGTIELTVVIALPYNAQLTVTSGVLENAAGGTIAALGGAAPGGARTLTATLDNQGLVDVQVPLLLNGASAVHLNSGTIDLSAADLTVSQGGVTPSLTNSGTVTIGAGRTLAVTGGSLTLQSGTLGGPGTLSLSSTTLGLGVGFDNAVTALLLTNSTVNGPGTLTNASGRTLTLVASTVNAAVDNQGTLVASGSSVINGALTTNVGSILRVGQVDGSTSQAALTVANGFVNLGTIELTVVIAIAYNAQLTVTSGTLVNAPGGTIAALGGAAPGGARTLTAALDNQGLVDVQVPLLLNGASAAHLNSGTIDLTAADLTVSQGGATPSLTNSGTITVAAGRSLGITGGQFTNTAAGVLSGAGTYTMSSGAATFDGAVPGIARVTLTNSNAAFASPVDVGLLALELNGAAVSGPSLTIPVGATLGLVGSTLNLPVDVQGTLLVSGNSAITGAVTTGGASSIQVGQVDGSTSLAHLTVANGFTNNGEIRLTVAIAIAYNAQLTLTSGILVNAGTIVLEPGLAAGGTRTIAAPLENQGVLVVEAPASLIGASADHVNLGSIQLTTANLTVNQSGSTPTFSNAGAITIGAGRTLAFTGGAFASEVDATIDGPGALSFANMSVAFNDATPTGLTLTLANTSASFLSDILTSSTTLLLSSATLTGSGTLINGPGQTLTLNNSTVNLPVDNQGTLIASAASAIGGSLITAPGSTIRIGQVDGSTSLANLTVAGGFTNAGAIELSVMFPVAYGAQLTLSSGTLVNAPGGTITTLDGLAAGGTRNIVGAVDNQGTITVGPGTPGRLGITGSLQSSGAIDLELGGTTPDTQFDRIVVIGTPGSLTLGGTLNVALISAFTPAAGNTFAILSALARTGTFATPNLPGGIDSSPTYSATGVTLVAP